MRRIPTTVTHIALALLLLLPASLPAAMIGYQYDALDRLIQASYPDGTVIEYSYDAAGNRTRRVILGSPAITHAITVAVNPPAGGSASCDPNPVPDGGDSSCTAIPNEGYEFVDWSGDCTGTTCDLVDVTESKSVTANFNCLTATDCDWELIVTPPSGGTITGTGINCGGSGSICTQTYSNGTTVSLTATPDSDWIFDAWGGVCASANTSTCTMTMDADKSVSATFVQLVDYTDVSDSHPAYDAITGLSSMGIISGCAADRFCPGQPLDRATLAQWLLSALEGGGYLPPFASGLIFNDVSASDFNADWIETLATRNITEGCTADGSRYCPSDLVSRASLAALLLKTRHGSAYSPAPAWGTVFDDVGADDFNADWIEDLWNQGITHGCDANRFCPNQPVTRAEGVLWLYRAFGP